MGARPGSTTSKRTERGNRQATRGGSRKPNRSDQQAARIRAAAAAAARVAAADDVPAEGARPARAGDGTHRPLSRAARTRALHFGTALTQEQEMAYVRTDLRRLLWIAGLILIAMFVLLAVLPT